MRMRVAHQDCPQQLTAPAQQSKLLKYATKNAKYEPAQQSKLLKYATKNAKYEPAQHHLVGHHLLVVLTGKGHIGEVSVIVKRSERIA